MTLRAPLTTVLVPTDFSEAADHALARALLLPLAERARVHVVHVVPGDAPRHERERRAEALSAQAARTGARDGLTLSSEVVAGEPFVEIIRCSRRVDAELVVLGRHGEHARSDASLLGSTARRVIRKGDVPVLAVVHRATAPYRRPVVATDLSDASRRVLDTLLRVVGREAEVVAIVHALHVPFEHFVRPTGSDKGRFRRGFEHKAEASVAALTAMYADAGVRWEPHVRDGDARTVIIEAALALEADLVALGTHGRSGIAHLLIGSVAEWVLDNAPTDVLVSHPVRFAFDLT